ncbi:peptidase S14 [Aliivibrio fischeri]|uniref:ClpP-like prohead protease/major capsid protein fusion protein n=1 Tax=Aliivibrio fischeri TaxID=668 RepID=UPI00080DD7AB|nr:ClpP-like prohead protease/major capsid protein fusion protein [Aliivibrio fischeri]OCH31830.1 peptidase S14 [Aliivibrio fischeri]
MKNQAHQSMMMSKASLSVSAGLSESWFSIKAATSGRSAEIFIYDEIGGWGMTAQRFSEELQANDIFTGIDVDLYIHSGGGNVLDGFAIYNMLRGITGKLNIYIQGVAASIASVIACVPNATVHIPENGWFYLHNAWGGQVGEAEDMIEYAEFLERNVTNMIAAYREKTGFSEDEIRALMKKPGTWIDGHQAVEQGFADVLTEPLQAAASINSNRQKELLNMPKSLQGLMKPQANTPTPTAPVTAPVTQPPEPTPTPAQPSASAADIMAQFRADETARRQGIQGVFGFSGGRYPDIEAACIADMNCTVDQAKDKLLEAMGKHTTPSAGVHIHAGNGNLVSDSVSNAIMARSGLGSLENDNAYNGMRLDALARASLVDRGIGISGLSNRDIVGLAFTHSSSDFGNILMNIANKSVLKGWEEAPETYHEWTQKGTLNDFRPSKRVGLNTFGSLDKIPEGGEYQYGKVGDRGEDIVLATYGKLLTLSRQAIINDDMQMLTRIPQLMGRSARRTIGDLVYAILTGSYKMSDGKALFHADHKNIVKGSKLDVETLSKGKTLMRTQKDGEASLNIKPGFVLSPVALEDKLNQIIRSTSVEGAGADVINPIANFAKVISEPRLDEANPNMFYQAADMAFDSIEVAYLDGIEEPYIEQQSGFTVDGVATKVRIDAGVAPLDYRTFVKHDPEA